MADSILVLGIVGVLVTATVGFLGFALNRNRKGYKLVITADGRNPTIGERTYFIMPDRAKFRMVIYKSPLSLKKEKLVAYFDPNSFKYGKTIFAMQGITGNPDDDNIVPFSKPFSSAPTALTQAKKLSTQIAYKLKQLGITNASNEKLITAGKVVEVTGDDGKKEKKTIQGITPEWLLAVFGIPAPVDSQVVLTSQRAMIEASNRIVNDFRNQNLSVFAKHGNLIVLGIVVFMLFIAFVPIISSTLQYQQGLGQATAQAIQAIAHSVNKTYTPVNIVK